MKNTTKGRVVRHTVEDEPVMKMNEAGEMEHIYSIIHLTPIDEEEEPVDTDLLRPFSLHDVSEKPIKQAEKLWGEYWHSGGLCLLAGDMGVGKTTLALQLAKSIARGVGFLGGENNNLPLKVLFVGFELSNADLLMRYGGGEVAENLVFANLNVDALAEGYSTLGTRLLGALDTLVEQTAAQVLIIDQPDRLHLQPAMWNYLMLKLNALKVQKGLSILLTLNNKPRNLSKAPTVSSLYRSNLIAPHADSIVCVANHCRAEGKRYIKILKNNGLSIATERPVEVFSIGLQNVTAEDEFQGAQNAQILLQPPAIMSVQVCGKEREENVLLPTVTERRQARMIAAEEMRHQGMGFREIALAMELPERTVRSWVGFIKAGSVVGSGESVARSTESVARSTESVAESGDMETRSDFSVYDDMKLRDSMGLGGSTEVGSVYVSVPRLGLGRRL